MEFFTLENFRNLEFKTPKDADAEIRRKAYFAGFEISARDSTKIGCCRYYCSKGGRKRGNISNKTDCPFYFKTMVVENKDETLSIKISPKKICLDHNHPFSTPKRGSFIDDQQTIETIKNMLKSDIQPHKIRKYLYNIGIKNISTLQIRLLDSEEKIQVINPESDDLINYIESQQGFYEIYSMNYKGIDHRLAVFTMTKAEEENFKSFGDVIFIDGTHIKLNLKWEVVPITLIDKNKNIRCGGILYASLFTEEVIFWFLELLLKFNFVKDKLETIITDEDSAFLIAFKDVFAKEENKTVFPVRHILCSLHKKRNFIKKINSLGLTQELKESLEFSFDVICYNFNHDVAMEHLGKLYDVPILKDYLDKEILPLLHMFSRSCLNGAHCLGYNVTSPAESMNAMLKRGLPERNLSLVESRIEFQHIFDNHLMLITEKLMSKRVPIDSILFQKYFPKIAEEIKIQVDESIATILIEEKSEYYTHKAYTCEHPNEIYRLNEWHCECGFIDFTGIPCCHMIALHSLIYNEFPVFHVDPRWNKTSEPFSVDESLFLSQALDADVVHDDSDDSITAPLQISDDEKYESTPMCNMSQGERYLKLFHTSKSICSLASESIEQSQKIANKLDDILSDLRGFHHEKDQGDQLQDTTNENEAESTPIKTIDHIDIISRPKGRPPKLKKAEKYTKPVQCLICLKAHRIVDCEHYDEYKKLISEAPAEMPGKRRCGLCRHYDHTIRTCPLRIKATQGNK